MRGDTMLRKFKIHTKYGAFEFKGRLTRDFQGWQIYDTDDGNTLRFHKNHIVMIQEAMNIEHFDFGMITLEAEAAQNQNGRS